METVKEIPSIKILHDYFEEVVAGRKRAELRFNDRNYKVGDVYDLKEWNAEKGEYTGRVQNILITHVLKDFAGLQEGWCMFSFKTFEEVFTGADFGDIRKAAENIKALKALIFGEWVDTDIIERALGISFSEGLKRFDFSRTAEWCSIAGKTEEERKKNGQIITTKFCLKNPEQAVKKAVKEILDELDNRIWYGIDTNADLCGREHNETIKGIMKHIAEKYGIELGD